MSHLPDFQIGVAGTGFIGPAHVEALRRLGITVAGIVGSSRKRLGHPTLTLTAIKLRNCRCG